MNDTVDVVDVRRGDKHRVEEFVEIGDYDVQQIANSIWKAYPEANNYIREVAKYIQLKYSYPMIHNRPSTDSKLLRFHKSLFSWFYNKYVPYMWSLPHETILFKCGVCIDTALLCTSLLRAKGIDAWTCLGEVRETSTRNILGYHAWTIAYYKGEFWLIETTIHRDGINTMVTTAKAYDIASKFSIDGNIYYVEHSKFNELNCFGSTELGTSGMIFNLLDKPAEFTRAYSLGTHDTISRKEWHKRWAKGDIKIHQKIDYAFWVNNHD